jgi:hypothetical protein
VAQVPSVGMLGVESIFQMGSRQYYSGRTGKNPLATDLDLPTLLTLFRDLYLHFCREGYFQEAFGLHCVSGYIPGTLGSDLEAQMFRKLRRQGLWPIDDKCLQYTEDDLFDVIEFLYDHISKPATRTYHEWNDCGWHYDDFDQRAGRTEFQSEINALLRDYGEGYELSDDGEILVLGQPGLDLLFEADIPSDDVENIETRVQAAIAKFRRRGSTWEDRRDAIRDLVDVLEFLRPKLKKVLTRKDESDLFHLANKFGIRHHDLEQKTDYDRAIWYSWMFYYYLATIHAALRLIDKYAGKSDSQDGVI